MNLIPSTVIAWINFGVLICTAILFLYSYIKSVQPAQLEKKIGEDAYSLCTRYRIIASLLMGITLINYVLFFFYPLPLPLPVSFPWSWSISALLALIIAVPGGLLWVRGLKDAGEESLLVKKEHSLYKGIYTKIRHPQAAGEITFWWVFAFLLNSPFLVLFSFVWIPIFYVMCLAEEEDLVIRYGDAYSTYRKNTGFLIPKRTHHSHD